jgi:glyoxylase-like metal-dependent hydrolase (beta-lactamase superfamily II)
VALRLDDIIFCGDMVVEGVTPHLSPETINPYSGLDHYLNSLQHFETWANGARLILNGHDEPITDLSAQIDATHKNIIRRMRRAMKALNKPLTIAEICTAIYGESTGYQLLLILEKTGAYVEYLYEHGVVEITNSDEVEQGQPAKYKRLLEVDVEELILKQRKLVAE